MLGPKYDKVTRITIADFQAFPEEWLPTTERHVMQLLEELPSGFTKDYAYGLGLAYPYRHIIAAIEGLTPCTHILLCDDPDGIGPPSADTYVLSSADFIAMRRSIDNIRRTSRTAARAVEDGTAYNFIASKLGQPLRPVPLGRSPLRQAFTNHLLELDGALNDSLPKADLSSLVTLVAKNADAIAADRPSSLLDLKNTIELATLGTLIERCETMMQRKLSEGKWQGFLNDHAFILTLAFGYPVIMVQERASVGGRTLAGTGDKITDFLVKNSLTNNAALIEIKTPGTKLLNLRPTRRGVYSPSSQFVGAMTQALDQKRNFERQISVIKDASGISDLQSYSVHCCLIIGTMPQEEEQRRSFEMFRGNSKDVAIVTFDELVEKLKNLRDFLKSS